MALRRLTSPGHRDARYQALIMQLRNRREDLDLSQEDLGKRLGLHQQFVSRVELLSRRLDAVELVDYAIALELDPAELIASIPKPD